MAVCKPSARNPTLGLLRKETLGLLEVEGGAVLGGNRVFCILRVMKVYCVHVCSINFGSAICRMPGKKEQFSLRSQDTGVTNVNPPDEMVPQMSLAICKWLRPEHQQWLIDRFRNIRTLALERPRETHNCIKISHWILLAVLPAAPPVGVRIQCGAPQNWMI